MLVSFAPYLLSDSVHVGLELLTGYDAGRQALSIWIRQLGSIPNAWPRAYEKRALRYK